MCNALDRPNQSPDLKPTEHALHNLKRAFCLSHLMILNPNVKYTAKTKELALLLRKLYMFIYMNSFISLHFFVTLEGRSQSCRPAWTTTHSTQPIAWWDQRETAPYWWTHWVSDQSFTHSLHSIYSANDLLNIRSYPL